MGEEGSYKASDIQQAAIAYAQPLNAIEKIEMFPALPFWNRIASLRGKLRLFSQENAFIVEARSLMFCGPVDNEEHATFGTPFDLCPAPAPH